MPSLPPPPLVIILFVLLLVIKTLLGLSSIKFLSLLVIGVVVVVVGYTVLRSTG